MVQYLIHILFFEMFQFVLSIAPDSVLSPRYKSGGMKFDRPISHGTQDFATNKSLYPLTEPVIKREAFAQTCGNTNFTLYLHLISHFNF